MTSARDELERLAEALTSGSCSASPAEPVSAETIWRAMEGELPPAEVEALADRAARDPDLAAEWRLAVAAKRLRDRSASTNVREFRPRLWRPWILSLAAAIMVLAVGLPVLLHHTASRQPAFRGLPPSPIERVAPDESAVSSGHLVLQWTCSIEGARYEVEVSDSSLRPVAKATDLKEPRFQVPADALRNFAPGAMILWRVWAVTQDGRRVGSPTFIEHLPAEER